MFDKEFISKLGKKSIGKDAALTKERVNAAWKRASKEQQREVFDLADVPYSTVYRIRSTGTITVKMTIAISQTLDLDPYYLLGAASENEGYSFDTAKKLLSEHKYARAVREFEIAHKQAAKEAAAAEEAKQEEANPAGAAPELTARAAIQAISEDDMVTLLKSVIIKSRTGKPEAIAAVMKITEMLLV